MSGSSLYARASRLALVAACASLTLAACNQPGAPSASNVAASNDLATNDLAAAAPLAALPLTTDVAPDIAPAPTAEALPAAPPVKVAEVADQGQAYAYADQAAAMNAGFGDAPPDYAFDNGGGQRPWVWRANDQSTRIAEPMAGGAYRYYYYQPGQSHPYLVRDAGYSYGYNNGALVVVYGPDGRILQRADLNRRIDVASRILARAAVMRAAAERDRRVAVAAANWAAQRDRIAREREAWIRARDAQAAWRAYHDVNRDRDQAYWAAERYRREAAAARFARQAHDVQAEQRALQEARRAQQIAAGRPPGGPQQGGQPWAKPGPFGPGGPQSGQALAGQDARAQAEAARRAQQLAAQNQAKAQADARQAAQAQAEAARQAQQTAARQQAQAAHQAQVQAEAARKAQALAARQQAQADAQAKRAAQAQADAAKIAAQRQAQQQAQAARQAQVQADAARKAQALAAQRQAQADAQAKRAAQADANAAKLAAQRQAQQQAQAARAAQAQAAAAHQAAGAAARQKAQAEAAADKATNSAHASPRGQE